MSILRQLKIPQSVEKVAAHTEKYGETDQKVQKSVKRGRRAGVQELAERVRGTCRVCRMYTEHLGDGQDCYRESKSHLCVKLFMAHLAA